MLDVIGLAGFALLCWGTWQFDPRIAFISSGAVLMAVAYKGTRN